jgi:hypothetical protein
LALCRCVGGGEGLEADEGKLRASTDREALGCIGFLKEVVEDAELGEAAGRDVVEMVFPARLRSGATGIGFDRAWLILAVVPLPPLPVAAVAISAAVDCDSAGRGKPDLPTLSACNGRLNLIFAVAVAVVLVDMLVPGLGGLG